MCSILSSLESGSEGLVVSDLLSYTYSAGPGLYTLSNKNGIHVWVPTLNTDVLKLESCFFQVFPTRYEVTMGQFASDNCYRKIVELCLAERVLLGKLHEVLENWNISYSASFFWLVWIILRCSHFFTSRPWQRNKQAVFFFFMTLFSYLSACKYFSLSLKSTFLFSKEWNM